jgi:hypothetical protein
MGSVTRQKIVTSLKSKVKMLYGSADEFEFMLFSYLNVGHNTKFVRLF